MYISPSTTTSNGSNIDVSRSSASTSPGSATPTAASGTETPAKDSNSGSAYMVGESNSGQAQPVPLLTLKFPSPSPASRPTFSIGANSNHPGSSSEESDHGRDGGVTQPALRPPQNSTPIPWGPQQSIVGARQADNNTPRGVYVRSLSTPTIRPSSSFGQATPTPSSSNTGPKAMSLKVTSEIPPVESPPFLSARSTSLIVKKSGQPLKSSLKSSKAHSRPTALSLFDIGSSAGGLGAAVDGLPMPMATSGRNGSKSEPTTPKIVSFDAQLERVKLFRAEQKPSVVSRDGSPTDTDGTTEEEWPGFMFGGRRASAVDKSQRNVSTSTQSQVVLLLQNMPPLVHRHAGDVHLESLEISSNPPPSSVVSSSSSSSSAIHGTILVRNIAYHKNVYARFTFDSWHTTSDVAARYSCSVDRPPLNFSASPRLASSAVSNSWDRFEFWIDIGSFGNNPDGKAKKELILAVKYVVDGREIWDSNEGKDYRATLELRPLPSPSTSTTSTTSSSSHSGGRSNRTRTSAAKRASHRALQRAGEEDNDQSGSDATSDVQGLQNKLQSVALALQDPGSEDSRRRRGHRAWARTTSFHAPSASSFSSSSSSASSSSGDVASLIPRPVGFPLMVEGDGDGDGEELDVGDSSGAAVDSPLPAFRSAKLASRYDFGQALRKERQRTPSPTPPAPLMSTSSTATSTNMSQTPSYAGHSRSRTYPQESLPASATSSKGSGASESSRGVRKACLSFPLQFPGSPPGSVIGGPRSASSSYSSQLSSAFSPSYSDLVKPLGSPRDVDEDFGLGLHNHTEQSPVPPLTSPLTSPRRSGRRHQRGYFDLAYTPRLGDDDAFSTSSTPSGNASMSARSRSTSAEPRMDMMGAGLRRTPPTCEVFGRVLGSGGGHARGSKGGMSSGAAAMPPLLISTTDYSISTSTTPSLISPSSVSEGSEDEDSSNSSLDGAVDRMFEYRLGGGRSASGVGVGAGGEVGVVGTDSDTEPEVDGDKQADADAEEYKLFLNRFCYFTGTSSLGVRSRPTLGFTTPLGKGGAWKAGPGVIEGLPSTGSLDTLACAESLDTISSSLSTRPSSDGESGDQEEDGGLTPTPSCAFVVAQEGGV